MKTISQRFVLGALLMMLPSVSFGAALEKSARQTSGLLHKAAADVERLTGQAVSPSPGNIPSPPMEREKQR